MSTYIAVQTRTKTIIGATIALCLAALLYRIRITSGSDDASRKKSPAPEATSAQATTPTVEPIVSVAEPPPVAVPGALPTDGGERSRLLFGARWGSGRNQLGRDRPQEGNPEGPMSLVMAGKDLLVLDQVNGRLVRYDANGRVLSETTASTTAQDIAVGKDGTVAMIDRLVDKSITILDPNGKKIGELPLGSKLAEPGLVTGVIVDGKDVYAEKEHGALILIGSTDGSVTTGPQLSGRPTRDGSLLLTAGIASANTGRAYVNAMDRASQTSRFAVQVAFPRPAQAIILLDSDARGTIYLGVAASEPPNAVIACLAPNDGHVLGKVTLPLSSAPEESFRDFTIGDDGAITFAVRNEDGVEYRTATCP